ncbi:MAG: hypothetical protein GWN84_20910, partial [Gammaproteobacteria bacterium]|nr:hypothetical protein [Gammaproteobacteria bacterium]NIR92088.1 hypothetical protein [Gammaproteobacteria bacterium]
MTIFYALAIAGCGGSSGQVASPAQHPAPGDAAQAASVADTTDGHEAPLGHTYGADPRLTVYVDGPDPADPTTEPSMVNAYRMEVVLTNTGDEGVGLENTKIWFDVWDDEGRVECPAADKQLVETPAELSPGDAFTIEADAICALPEPGEYEVRAYLSI